MVQEAADITSNSAHEKSALLVPNASNLLVVGLSTSFVFVVCIDATLGRLRNLLKRPIVGARSEDADHQDDHGHGKGDEGKDADRAEMEQEEGDHVAVEGRGDATEGVDKSHCPGPHARREQLGLVGVIGIG